MDDISTTSGTKAVVIATRSLMFITDDALVPAGFFSVESFP
jgi:hypothetical protein